MNGTIWRGKVLAFLIHFLVTLLFGVCAWVLIFVVWFPHPLEQMVGGSKLFYLVLGCDLVLGPLLSLVVFDSRKSRRHLLLDYSVIGVLQVAALLYGVYVVSLSRPLYVAFIKDRLEVITAVEIDRRDFLEVSDPEFDSMPWSGPKEVYVEMPTDPDERNQALLLALAGKDVSQTPKYFRRYSAHVAEVLLAARPVADLASRKPSQAEVLAAAQRDLGLDRDRVLWLPVKHRFGFWTVLIDAGSGELLRYLPIDPYD